MSGVIGNVDSILSEVLDTRLKRKAKSIILTTLQLLLTDGVLALRAVEENDQKNEENGTDDDRITLSLKIMLGVSAGYAVLLSIFSFFHSLCLPSNLGTKKEVEDAYKKTNKIPIFDSLVEIAMAIKFRGTAWWVIWIMWGMFLGISVTLFLLFVILRDSVQNSTIAAVTVAVFQLYQITGDFSEYWICTRHCRVEIGTADDDEDMNAQIY